MTTHIGDLRLLTGSFGIEEAGEIHESQLPRLREIAKNIGRDHKLNGGHVHNAYNAMGRVTSATDTYRGYTATEAVKTFLTLSTRFIGPYATQVKKELRELLAEDVDTLEAGL